VKNVETIKLNPNILVKYRYDIVVKYLYAKALEENNNIDLFKNIYKNHLQVWNGFFENEPRKVGFDAYNESFKKILNDIKNNNFNWSMSPIPINGDYPLNGGHRVASCMLYNKDVYCYRVNQNCEIWERNFFINKGLNKEYVEIIDNEIIKNKILYGN
jgi:hypothetical protein